MRPRLRPFIISRLFPGTTGMRPRLRTFIISHLFPGATGARPRLAAFIIISHLFPGATGARPRLTTFIIISHLFPGATGMRPRPSRRRLKIITEIIRRTMSAITLGTLMRFRMEASTTMLTSMCTPSSRRFRISSCQRPIALGVLGSRSGNSWITSVGWA
jgi:hypothetical protein